MVRVFFFLLFCSMFGITQAQYYDYDENSKDTLNTEVEGIDIYEKFNLLLGGDSVRYKSPGVKFNGWYEDNYKSGKLKHKGYYNNGSLTTVYKNYYENGQMERSFKVRDVRTYDMELYYNTGVLKSKVEYYKGQALIWTDYYSNGNMEYYEENEKSFEYYIKMNFYFENGKPQNTLELIDKKNRMYAGKEYFETGQVKEEGTLMFNQALSDYQKTGTWIIYDVNGKKIAEEDYEKGSLNDERKY